MWISGENGFQTKKGRCKVLKQNMAVIFQGQQRIVLLGRRGVGQREIKLEGELVGN